MELKQAEKRERTFLVDRRSRDEHGEMHKFYWGIMNKPA